MRMHAIEQPPPLTEVAADTPPRLEEAVMRAMRKEPEERPTAAQLGLLLRELLQEHRVSGRGRRVSDLHRA